MFYSPVYLKKTGRFGLIWLAATQTKVLSKRELATIHISTICSDIFTHIPGMKDRGSRASRFSLYLCCQLMYGSIKVLQKQWDILLVDAQMLCRKCTDTPSITKDIDMAATRQVVCIDSNVPMDDRGANVDPYFGATKEGTIDVVSMLTYLESLSESRVLRLLEPLPMPVKPEIGSSNSVSDPKEIQILDVDISSMSIQIPEEQDLPKMDIETFLSINQDESLLEIQEGLRDGVVDQDRSESERHQQSLDEQILPNNEGQVAVMDTEDGNVSAMREILMEVLPHTAIPMTDISVGPRGPLSPLEETPRTKPTSGMPNPPHKPKLDRPKRQRDPSKKGSRFQDICNGNLQSDQDQPMPDAVTEPMTSSDDSFLLLQQQKDRQKEIEASDKGHGLDWAQKNPPVVDLPPLPIGPTDSPLRKKRPHKLVIDQCLMLSRLELRQQMADTADTVVPLELPITTKAMNIYREPSLTYLKQKGFVDLFTRNCKFGLKMDDTGSERDSLPSPRLADFLSRKRARGVEDVAETPANKIARNLTSEVASMEKARDRTAGSLSDSLDRNTSHSMVREDSARKRSSSSSIRGNLNLSLDNDTSRDGSIPERDTTLNLGAGALTTWPEEQEVNISPIRRVSEAVGGDNVEKVVQPSMTDEMPVMLPETSPPQQETAPTNGVMTDSSQAEFSDSPRTTVFKLVKDNLRTSHDWTTFQAICPPSTYSRKVAASMFNALCAQISRGKLCARQDEPYGYIFIWVQESLSSSGTSASTEY